jgi:hypothetical protein
MKKNTLVLIIVALGLLLFVSNQKQDKEIIYLSSDSEDDDDDDVPSEPSRYYDSKYTTRQQMRINVPTRGEPPSYQQVGILTDTTDGENVKPLYGRQTYRGSNQWNYFTSLDSHLATRIPITIDENNCTDERGCIELNKSDTIHVNTKDYNIDLYKFNAPRYIP